MNTKQVTIEVIRWKCGKCGQVYQSRTDADMCCHPPTVYKTDNKDGIKVRW